MKYIKYAFSIMVFAVITLFTLSTISNARKSLSSSITICENYEESILLNKTHYFAMEQPEFLGKDGEVALVFFTDHSRVQAYVQGRLIYSESSDYERLGHTPGQQWHFVRIPKDTKKVDLYIKNVYNSTDIASTFFLVGDELAVFKYIFGKSFSLLLMDAIIVLLGILMFGYSRVLKSKVESAHTLTYLGLFAFLLGVWSAIDNDTLVLLFPFRNASSNLSYLLLGLMPIPFLLFARDFLSIKESVLWKTICYGNILIFALSILLQTFNIKDLKETLIGSQTILGLSVLYVSICILRKIISGERSRRLNISIASLLVVALFSGGKYLLHSAGYNTNAEVSGRLGLLIFIILLSFDVADEVSRTYQEARKNEMYKEMATKDWLTGMGSRNAFSMAEDALDSLENIGYITFDLNNLKKCNDFHGHAAGDRYLTLASSCIKDVFSPYGQCYRVGGDEFCCLINDWLHCPADSLIESLREAEKEANKISNIPVKIQIAVGYAGFDPSIDQTFKNTKDRADEMMYENKEYLKKNNND